MSKSGPQPVQPLGFGSAVWVRSCAICRKRRPGDELLGLYLAGPGEVIVTRLAGQETSIPVNGAQVLASRGTSEDDSALPAPGIAELVNQLATKGAAHAPRHRNSYTCPSAHCAAVWLARMDRGRGESPSLPALLQAVRTEVQTRIRKRGEGLARRCLAASQDQGLRGLNGLLQALSEQAQGPRSAAARVSRRGDNRA